MLFFIHPKLFMKEITCTWILLKYEFDNMWQIMLKMSEDINIQGWVMKWAFYTAIRFCVLCVSDHFIMHCI